MRFYKEKTITFIFLLFMGFHSSVFAAKLTEINLTLATSEKISKQEKINIESPEKFSFLYLFEGNIKNDLTDFSSTFPKKYDKTIGKGALFSDKFKIIQSSKYEKAKTCTFDVFENGEYTLVLETSSGKFLYKEFAISNMDNIPPENVSNVKYTIYPDKHILLSWENPKDSDFTKIKLLINDEKIELNKDVTKYLKELKNSENVKLSFSTIDDVQNESEQKIIGKESESKQPLITSIVLNHSFSLINLTEDEFVDFSVKGFNLDELSNFEFTADVSSFGIMKGSALIDNPNEAIIRFEVPAKKGNYSAILKNLPESSEKKTTFDFETFGKEPFVKGIEFSHQYDEEKLQEDENLTFKLIGYNLDKLTEDSITGSFDEEFDKNENGRINVINKKEATITFDVPEKKGSYEFYIEILSNNAIENKRFAFDTFGKEPFISSITLDKDFIQSEKKETVKVTVNGFNLNKDSLSDLKIRVDSKDYSLNFVDSKTSQVSFVAPNKNGSYDVELINKDSTVASTNLKIKKPVYIKHGKVTVPQWMTNSVLIYSGMLFGSSKTIGDFFSNPKESTEIEKLSVTDSSMNIVIAYKNDNVVVMRLSAEFQASRLKDTGTCFLSSVIFEIPLTYQKHSAYCNSPNDMNRYGQCLGFFSQAIEQFYDM